MTAKSAKVSEPRDFKLIIEKDVRIPLRDGTFLCGDSYPHKQDIGAANRRLPKGTTFSPS